MSNVQTTDTSAVADASAFAKAPRDTMRDKMADRGYWIPDTG